MRQEWVATAPVAQEVVVTVVLTPVSVAVIEVVQAAAILDVFKGALPDVAGDVIPLLINASKYWN